MTNPIDIHISIQRWITLSRRSGLKLGVLTPLFAEEETATLLHIATDMPSSEEAYLLKQLADPQAANGLSFILQDGVIDLALFYPAEDYPDAVISLAYEEDRSLHLQYPAPIADVLGLLRSQLGDAKVEVSPVDLEMPVLQAWLFWALIDLLREAIGEDGSLHEPSFDVDAMMAILGRPFDVLNNLGAYYRQSLNLTIPLKKDVEAALRVLAGKGLIAKTSSGYKPGSLLREQALEFSDVGAHLMLKTNLRLPDGTSGTMRNFVFQGKSGNGLLWYDNGGITNFLALSPAQIVNLVDTLIRDPLHFFEQVVDKGSPPKGTSPRRRPPPPERLS